ncbi:hypothetical protein PIB30_049006 [Stylosanthes scabra]|uniref:Uncharacterized protein n=1 Tax=Stylosanthes scabra TaxID=79078 RepID=A0ABU6ZG15_9FABA|nr:hypothetical protein [Stylosanthes scabra]
MEWGSKERKKGGQPNSTRPKMCFSQKLVWTFTELATATLSRGSDKPRGSGGAPNPAKNPKPSSIGRAAMALTLDQQTPKLANSHKHRWPPSLQSSSVDSGASPATVQLCLHPVAAPSSSLEVAGLKVAATHPCLPPHEPIPSSILADTAPKVAAVQPCVQLASVPHVEGETDPKVADVVPRCTAMEVSTDVEGVSKMAAAP